MNIRGYTVINKKAMLRLFLIAIFFMLIGVVISSVVPYKNTYYSYLDIFRLKIHKESRTYFIDETNYYLFEISDVVKGIDLPIYDLILSENDVRYFKNLYK